MRRLAIFLMLTATVASVPAVAAGSPSAPELPDPVPCDGCWAPALETSWQWRLLGPTTAALPSATSPVRGNGGVQTPGGSPIACSAGRPGWPGERWLDIGRTAILRPIMERRLAMCERKGFDAVEFRQRRGLRPA